ncbi:MAG: hypothetical protein GF418_08985 [Chitinivibrionales bacterium]|nr:hypothetical protein [Chitinivibrionales bacterium]MBD3395748.1 hypothetical protein [Chitinivibrionales bacterium]
MRMLGTCLLLGSTVTALHADMDSAALESFETRYEDKYRREYRECTGDTARVHLKKILAWRQHIHEIADSPEYRELVRKYMKETGDTHPVPCKVIKWHDERRAGVDEVDAAIAEAVMREDDRDVDSIVLEDNLEGNAQSPYDLGDIPFGVSRTAFRWLFKRQFGLPLTDMETHLYAKGFTLEGHVFLLAFFFNSDNRLYRYEIEGNDHAADSLNQITRPEAKALAGMFERKLGQPTSTHRVGYFDIKPGKLSPLARWYKRPYGAYVGFSAHNHRYYAKAIVVNEHLLQH